jgi:hypothetical protein
VRVFLNLYTGLLQQSVSSLDAIATIEVSLGQAPLRLVLIAPPATLNRIEFVAKQRTDNTPLWSGANIVSGGVDVTDTLPASCGENWLIASLVALFIVSPVPSSVALTGQFRWRDSSDAAWRYLAAFAIDVANTLFAVSASGTQLVTSGAQTGLKDIGAAVDTVAVTFDTAFATAPRLVLATVEKPSGGDNIFATVRRDLITVNGFTAELSGPTPDANHKLAWLAYL